MEESSPEGASIDLPEPPAPADTGKNTGFQVLGIAGYLALCTALLLAAVIVSLRLAGLLRYRYGSPEEKLALDAEAIKKQIRREAGEDFPDRGLLSDYVSRAPADLQEDVRRIFDVYYRILYGDKSAAGVSPSENDLARRVREELDRKR